MPSTRNPTTSKDWRERHLEVVSAAAEYVNSGCGGIAFLAAAAILADAFGVRGRSTLVPPTFSERSRWPAETDDERTTLRSFPTTGERQT